MPIKLKTTPIVKKKIATLHRRYNYESGVSCKFFKLTDKIGIKVYETANRRDHCYYLQKIAAKKGLAPEVGEKVNLINDKHGKYAFLTEVATDIDYDESASYSELIKLKRELRKIGIVNKDDHGANLAFKDEKLIFIDFSHAWMPKMKKYKKSPCWNL